METEKSVGFIEFAFYFICRHPRFFGVATCCLVAGLHWLCLPVWSASPYVAGFHCLFWGLAVFMSCNLVTTPHGYFRDDRGDFYDHKSKFELLRMGVAGMPPRQLLTKLPVYLVWQACEFCLRDTSLWISVPIFLLVGLLCFGHVLCWESEMTPGGEHLDVCGGMNGVVGMIGIVFTHNFLAAMILDIAFEYHLGISYQESRETKPQVACS